MEVPSFSHAWFYKRLDDSIEISNPIEVIKIESVRHRLESYIKRGRMGAYVDIIAFRDGRGDVRTLNIKAPDIVLNDAEVFLRSEGLKRDKATEDAT